MRAILPLVALIAGLAACDSPTAPSRMLDGSVRFSDLNPQPLPPGRHFSTTTTSSTCIAATTLRVAGSSGLYQPPDPCLK